MEKGLKIFDTTRLILGAVIVVVFCLFVGCADNNENEYTKVAEPIIQETTIQNNLEIIELNEN